MSSEIVRVQGFLLALLEFDVEYLQDAIDVAREKEISFEH